MSIDEAIKQLETYTIPCGKYKAAYDLAVDTMRKYQQLQADYEARLRADMAAMLTEIQLEFEEMDSGCGWEGYRPTAQVIGLIQQKINILQEARS